MGDMTTGKGAAILLAVASLVSAARGAAPNLLLVTVDTLRPDRLSCYSPDHVKTPAIDALAAGGALFERTYAHTPTTLPSHTSLFLGKTPAFHGVSENSKARVSAAFLTLAEHLKKQGFATGAFVGAFPLDSRFGLDQGFDVYDDSFPKGPAAMGFASERTADAVVKAAVAWISARSGPWFCWIHLWDPHAPYDPPEPYRSEYASDPYSGEAAFVDSQLAVLFEGLRKRDRAGRTVIVLTSDHGESLGEHGELTHGYFAYDSTLHVPLIIAGPGVRPGRIAARVGHVDIFPTVCALLGAPVPSGLHGRSLAPLMKGGRDTPRPHYFESLEPHLNYGCAPLRGFIDGSTKFIDSPLPEVYDLSRDPREATNAASEADVPALKRKLETILKAQAGPAAGQTVVDAQTREKLRSLGYVVSAVAPLKAVYGPEDDLKSFLPFQQRLERAILKGDAGQDAEAVREMEALIREKRQFAPAYIYLAQIHLARDRVAEGLRTLEEGVRANPRDYALLAEYGKALVRAGRSGEAADILEKAVALIDYDPESWSSLGRARMGTGARDLAVQAFDRALALDPSSASTHSDIGALRLSLYLEGGRNAADLEQAISHFEKAAASDSTLNPAFRGLGYAYRLAGRADAAIKAWEKAVAIRPDDDFSAYNLGLLCLERGDKARAKRLFNAILELRGAGLAPADRENLLALIEKCK